MTVMPIFPLGSVLLPAMPMPLRIFEPRYLKLLGDLMESEEPEFGIVLIERGPEVGGGEKRMSIGTIAKVTNIGTTDEYYGLESVGTSRFIVHNWLPDNPYPMAEIELIPDLVWDEELAQPKANLEKRVRRFLSFASEFVDLPYNSTIEFSDNPLEACWQLGGVLPIGEFDQVDLLRAESTEDLISRIDELVTASDELLRAMMNQISDQEDDE